jgi:hypothetical protein
MRLAKKTIHRKDAKNAKERHGETNRQGSTQRQAVRGYGPRLYPTSPLTFLRVLGVFAVRAF